MSRFHKICLILCLGVLLSSCPVKQTLEYGTIESVFAILFSFDENGVFPHTESFRKEELGIGIYPDSLSYSYELAQSLSLIRSAYATEPPVRTIYTNAIDSVHVFTIYDFDADHSAGSNVNDLLLFLDDMGEVHEGNIAERSDVYLNFKFTAVPQYDSLQFMVTGTLSGEHPFNLMTARVVFK